MKYSIIMPIHQFYPLIGGAEQQAQRLAKSLVENGHRITVLTGRWDREQPQREFIEGIHVYRNTTLWPFLSKFGRLRFGVIRQYSYEISLLWFLWSRRKEYDLIHVHQALHAAVFSTFMACFLLKKKVIIKVGCGGHLSDLKMMKECRITPFGKQFWQIIKRCDRIVAINDEIETELLEDGFLRKQVVKIPNGIPLEWFPLKTNYKIGLKAQIVSVGRLDPQKGFDVLIAALAQLHGGAFVCNVFGGGKEREALKCLIDDAGVTNKVHLRGIVHDLRYRLVGEDVFILSSRAEGLSNALLEAMAAGLPCIATNIGGNSDLIHPSGGTINIGTGEFFMGTNGILVNVDDPIGLAGGVNYMISNHALREQLGRKAREWVEANCSMAKVTELYQRLYNELLESGVTASC
jgi:L-malate glycosyltransferase